MTTMSSWFAPTVALILAACATQTEGPTQTETPGAASSAAAATTATGGAGMDTELVTVARNAPKVDKIKLRTDDTGAFVKQAVYHDDANAIPEAVKALASTKFPKATVKHYETEQYADRGRVFEVEVETADGKICEVAATADGTEVYTECRVDPKTLATDVTAAVGRAVPGGKIIEAETKKGPDIDEISIEVEKDGRVHYVRLAPDGKALGHYLRIPAIVEVPVP